MKQEERLHIPARSAFAIITFILVGCKGFITVNVDMETIYPHITALIDYSCLVAAALTAVFWAYKEIMWRVAEFLEKQSDDLDMVRFINDYRMTTVFSESFKGGHFGNILFADLLQDGNGADSKYTEDEKKGAINFFIEKKNKRFSEAQEIVNRYYELN